MSDKRLIDAKALLKVPNVRRVTEYDEAGYGMTYSAIPDWAVMEAPTIDAMPVVHAMWEQRKNIILCAGEHGCYEAMPWNYYTQSKFDWKLPAHCPHCGAMMDGGAEG